MDALSQLFWASRPISWINTAYPFAATYLFVAQAIDATLVLGTLFFLIPYNLLMYGINDVFDYESDLRNPRKGGIEGALLAPKWHRLTLWSSVLACLPFVAYLIWVGNLASNAWLLLVLFSVVAYSAKGLRFKERPFLDSLTSAAHFVGPMVFAAALAGANLADPKLLALIAAFGLWGIASHAFGAVQDVRADREANIDSIATKTGARFTTRFAFAAYLLAGLLLLAVGGNASGVAIAAIPYLVVVGRFWNITDETCETANRGWKRFIWLNFFAGFVVTQFVIEAAIESGAV